MKCNICIYTYIECSLCQNDKLHSRDQTTVKTKYVSDQIKREKRNNNQ